MLSKKLIDAVNKQINAEFDSAYLYLSMSAYCETKNLSGFANWMRIQFQEEQAHAFMLYDYLISRGADVVLDAINKPKSEFGSPIDVFKAVLKHEQSVTASINALMELAVNQKDYATTSFLQWFVDEQVEEESTVEDIIAQLELAGESGQALFMFDKEFKTRTFVPPVRN